MKIAAIDIGTNSVRLLVLDEAGRELERLMEITRLGQGVDRTGQLAPEAIARTVDVLARYGERMRAHAVTRARITATSAARDSSNRAEFFEQVAHATGFAPELLPGDEEAQLSFVGATRSFANEDGPNAEYVVFDIGGGSTEFARGRDKPQAFLSLDMGSVRITERFLHSDPAQAAEVTAARAHIRELLAKARQHLSLSGAELWIGVAGTVTSFASACKGATHYDPALTHKAELSLGFVNQFTSSLLAAPLSDRESLVLEKKRAPVIGGGALILSEILDYFGLPAVRSSERDILDGLASSLL
jgi:exopolyphosphatase/guanosine-5'-triphosphate,3'-diphosphate pyrophosphatase